MITRAIFKGSVRQSVFEVTLIVIGVMIALWVDEWRANLAEKNAVRQHLVAIVAEIDSNRFSLHKIRDTVIPRQISALESVIQILDQPDPKIENAEQFIDTLILSTYTRSPWFERNSFDSFMASENYHSTYIQRFTSNISDPYEAQSVLFRERFDFRDAYKDAVSRLIPAWYQSEKNEMRVYGLGQYLAPVIKDEKPTKQVISEIIKNRTEFVQLARHKAERVTAEWYAMTRIIRDFQVTRDKIVNHPLMQGVELHVADHHANLDDSRL